jgi:catechol 2,3-dioxygenase-like lactoylglutathione lyase family enzyme
MARFDIMHIDHVVLRARDAARLTRFYVDVLGCSVERQLEIGLTQLRAGTALIDIVPVDSELGRRGGSGPAPDGSGRNLDHFCLRIEPFDADSLVADLRSREIQCSDVMEVYGAEGFGPSVYVQDPEGNVVELKGAGGGGGS